MLKPEKIEQELSLLEKSLFSYLLKIYNKDEKIKEKINQIEYYKRKKQENLKEESKSSWLKKLH